MVPLRRGIAGVGVCVTPFIKWPWVCNEKCLWLLLEWITQTDLWIAGFVLLPPWIGSSNIPVTGWSVSVDPCIGERKWWLQAGRVSKRAQGRLSYPFTDISSASPIRQVFPPSLGKESEEVEREWEGFCCFTPEDRVEGFLSMDMWGIGNK